MKVRSLTKLRKNWKKWNKDKKKGIEVPLAFFTEELRGIQYGIRGDRPRFARNSKKTVRHHYEEELKDFKSEMKRIS